MARELLVKDAVVVEPVTRVRRRRVMPKVPKFYGEKPLYWWSFDAPEGEWHYGFAHGETIQQVMGITSPIWAVTTHDLRWVLFDEVLLEPDRRRHLQNLFWHETNHVLPFGMLHQHAIARLLGGRRNEEGWCDHLAMASMPLFDAKVIRLPPLPRPKRIADWRAAV
jgi:hypothetical protein